MEKRKKYKRQRRINFCKFLTIGFTLFLLYLGIKVVNENIIYLEYLKNPTIFSVNIKERTLDLFGKSYFIDLKILKRNH